MCLLTSRLKIRFRALSYSSSLSSKLLLRRESPLSCRSGDCEYHPTWLSYSLLLYTHTYTVKLLCKYMFYNGNIYHRGSGLVWKKCGIPTWSTVRWLNKPGDQLILGKILPGWNEKKRITYSSGENRRRDNRKTGSYLSMKNVMDANTHSELHSFLKRTRIPF